MEARHLVLTWAALMLLLALTVAASFVFVGAASLVVGLGIAGLKAALILWVFMHLSEESGLPRVIAVAAFAWLGVLFVLGGLVYIA